LILQFDTPGSPLLRFAKIAAARQSAGNPNEFFVIRRIFLAIRPSPSDKHPMNLLALAGGFKTRVRGGTAS
jgi:hypothetical protein